MGRDIESHLAQNLGREGELRTVGLCCSVSAPGWDDWSRDKTSSDGDADDQASDQTVGPHRDISEGGGDGQVAVDADGGEAEDGGGAEEDVSEDPDDATGGGWGDQLKKMRDEVEMKRGGAPAARRLQA